MSANDNSESGTVLATNTKVIVTEQFAGYGWLFVCIAGTIASLTLYGILLEYVTIGGRELHELSFLFVTACVNSTVAYSFRYLFKESSSVTYNQMMLLAVTAMASTYTSIRSLKYVIFPVQVVMKSCKPIPVMITGVILGKQYKFHKYIIVLVITVGVATFMLGGYSVGKPEHGTSTMWLGGLLLFVSLCFDGATGAYEDQIMAVDKIGPFDLMFKVQLGKAILALAALIITNGFTEFVLTLQEGGWMLVILGVTSAMGQIFVFLTISKFGALNCALIGLLRKCLSLLMSFFLYGHPLSFVQSIGLAVTLTGMFFNFYHKSKSGGGHGGHGGGSTKPASVDEKPKSVNTSVNRIGQLFGMPSSPASTDESELPLIDRKDSNHA